MKQSNEGFIKEKSEEGDHEGKVFIWIISEKDSE